MVDLKMTDSGDIVIEKQNKLPSFHLFWRNHSLPSFRLRWKQGRAITKNNEHDFHLKFFTGEAEKKNIVPILYDEDELRQRIIMELRTEYGSVEANIDLGCNLYQGKHEDITDDRTVKEVKRLVEEVVKEHLDNPSVEVKHAYGKGAFYCQNLNVYIYNNNKLFYEFATEDLFW